MRWDGARQPVIWCVPAPQVDPQDAQLELVRAQETVTIEPWLRLSAAAREAIEREAAGLPLPGIGDIVVRWV